MGLFKPFIGGPGVKGAESSAELSDKILTPANAMTAARPILAIKAADMLLKGEVGVTPIVITMAASDMEGKAARFIDKRFPELGRGATKFGTEADQIADSAAILIVAGAALKAPRVSLPAKFAIGTVLGQESAKAVWATNAALQYAKATRTDDNPRGEKLVIPTLDEGKEAMAEKLTAVVLGVMTNDFDDWRIRTGLGAGAVGLALVGSHRGENVRQQYAEQFEQMMAFDTNAPLIDE